jgi:hypothetical protein
MTDAITGREPGLAVDWTRLRESQSGIHVERLEWLTSSNPPGVLVEIGVVRRGGKIAPLIIGLLLYRCRQIADMVTVIYTGLLHPVTGARLEGDKLDFHVWATREQALAWHEQIAALSDHGPTGAERWLFAGLMEGADG